LYDSLVGRYLSCSLFPFFTSPSSLSLFIYLRSVLTFRFSSLDQNQALNQDQNGGNRAQKSSSEGNEGNEDIFRFKGGPHFSCYHNGCDFHTNDEKEYHRHAAQKHRGIPVLYPTKAELEKYGVKTQGKSWEI
jgi:hypothetical protein